MGVLFFLHIWISKNVQYKNVDIVRNIVILKEQSIEFILYSVLSSILIESVIWFLPLRNKRRENIMAEKKSLLIDKSKIAYGDVYCFNCMKALKKAKNKKAG